MLNKEELSKIREALPFNGTKLIKERLETMNVKRISDSQISRTLNQEKHYRKDIIDAALNVITDHLAAIQKQRSIISELAAS